MTKRKKVKQPSVSEMTPEQLQDLDHSTLVGMVLRVLEQNRQLSEILQQMVREKNGPKTERFENPEQLRLFDSSTGESETEIKSSAVELSTESSSSSSNKTKAKKTGHQRNPMPTHLPRIKIVGDLPSEHELRCCACALNLEMKREILRSSRFEVVPASVFIEDSVAIVYACPGCGDTTTFEPPAPIIENGTAGPGLITDIAVSKFADHLPWYRQEQRFSRMGVPIARSTMVGWIKWAAGVLRPLYDRMHQLLLRAKSIATDDTPVKVQDRSLRRKLAKKLNIKTARIWTYRGDENQPFNLFNYTEGRGRIGPMSFLAGFKGYLQGDCFSGNLALCAESGATFVACLVHARRYFIKALPNNKTACETILKMFSDLFEIERTARELDLPSDQVTAMRNEESRPLLERMKKWLDEQILTALPKSSFGKAVNYCLNNWVDLNAFLLDGDLRPDNNLAEQEMKRIACGRKNWYFLGSDEGGKTAEVMLSIMSTCCRHDINPAEYFQEILEILAKNPDFEVDSLLPHVWKQNRIQAKIDGCQITPKKLIA